MMKRTLVLAAALSATLGMAANAAPLSGLFTVTAVNVTNLFGSESQADKNMDDFNAALAGTLGGANSVSTVDTFTYDGALDFRVGAPQNATQSIESWLGTGSGTVSGLETINNLQLSASSIGNGTATTTFFLFSLDAALNAADFTINHDDGMAVFDDGAWIGGVNGPTGERQTFVSGFDGGMIDFLYVATNGNPSVFEVDMQPVPVPATLPLLLGAMGMAGWVGRRRKAA